MKYKEKFTGKRSWFLKDRFGMFIHFGLYTYLGKNCNHVRKGPKHVYANLMDKFNPQRFNAEDWVKLARDSGCKYIVPTAKHADGFCLFDSMYTQYKSTNATFKRDIIAELAEACAKLDMRLGLYYNLESWLDDNGEHTEETYSGFIESQIKELCSNYGEICMFWFDHAHPLVPLKNMVKIIRMIHDMQPAAVVNNRGISLIRHNKLYGDFVTPERFIPEFTNRDNVYVECCDAIGKFGWGYNTDESFLSVPELIKRLCKAISIGGNYLLNIGPGPDGTVCTAYRDRMLAIGKWFEKYGDILTSSDKSPLIPKDSALLSYPKLGTSVIKKNKVYYCLNTWPSSDSVFIEHLDNNIKKAYLLNSDVTLDIIKQKKQESSAKGLFKPAGYIIRGLPPLPVENTSSVLCVECDGDVKIKKSAVKAARKKILNSVPGEAFTLMPDQAEVDATDGVPFQHLNHYYNGTCSLGCFIKTGLITNWYVRIDKKDEYNVIAGLGTTSAGAGTQFRIRCAGKSVSGLTEENGFYDVPGRLELGVLELDEGLQKIELKIDKQRLFFPDIHYIKFVPANRVSKSK